MVVGLLLQRLQQRKVGVNLADLILGKLLVLGIIRCCGIIAKRNDFGRDLVALIKVSDGCFS